MENCVGRSPCRPGYRRRTGLHEIGSLAETGDEHVIGHGGVAETQGMIGAQAFAQMRPESIFIKISRGKVVDGAALIEALSNQQICGAELDVSEREPLNADSPLLQIDSVVATPHMGSATHETREAMARCAADNLLAALQVSGR